MLIDPATLLFYVTASLLLAVAPGPDIVYLVAQGAANGPRAGLATALGLAAGNLVHTLGAALGISVIFQTSALAFTALKFAGVGYLLYLAWRALRAPAAAPGAGAPPRLPAERGAVLFRRGVLMNVLNPKVALFFLAFLPQFVTPAAGPVWLQMLFYGVVFTLLVALVFGAIGLSAGAVSRVLVGEGGWLARHGRWLVAGIFGALAVRLALVTR
jgi:threonine/homoserine/homoserine lactone efflux protein